MAAKAVESKPPPGSSPLVRPAAAPNVVQRKINHHGAWLKQYEDARKSPYSRTVQSYNQDPDDYVMRDDSEVGHRRIHLLEKRLYLFPEVHGKPADRAWAHDIRGWSTVSKLVEGDWSIPTYKKDQRAPLAAAIAGHPDVRGLTPAMKAEKIKGVPKAQTVGNVAFEDLHARLLTVIIVIFNWINFILADRDITRRRRKFREIIFDISDKIDEASTDIELLKQYTAGKFKMGKESVQKPNIDAAYTAFYNKLFSVFKPKMQSLLDRIRLLAVVSKYQDREKTDTKAALAKAPGSYLDEIEEGKLHQFLPEFARDLRSLLGVKDDPAEPDDFDKIEPLLAPTSGATNKTVYAATSTIRDSGMVTNAASAELPALVKIGTAHEQAFLKAFPGKAITVPESGLSVLTRRRRPKKASSDD
jgi:hypothetical protein